MERYGFDEYLTRLSGKVDQVQAFNKKTTAKMTAYHAWAMKNPTKCNPKAHGWLKEHPAEEVISRLVPRFYSHFKGYFGAGRRHTTRADWEAFAKLGHAYTLRGDVSVIVYACLGLDKRRKVNRLSGYAGKTISPRTRFNTHYRRTEGNKRWYGIVDNKSQPQQVMPVGVWGSEDEHDYAEIAFLESFVINALGFRGGKTYLELDCPELFGWLLLGEMLPEPMRGNNTDPLNEPGWGASRRTMYSVATPEERTEQRERKNQWEQNRRDVVKARWLADPDGPGGADYRNHLSSTAQRRYECKAQWLADPDGPGGATYRSYAETSKRWREQMRLDYLNDPDGPGGEAWIYQTDRLRINKAATKDKEITGFEAFENDPYSLETMEFFEWASRKYNKELETRNAEYLERERIMEDSPDSAEALAITKKIKRMKEGVRARRLKLQYSSDYSVQTRLWVERKRSAVLGQLRSGVKYAYKSHPALQKFIDLTNPKKFSKRKAHFTSVKSIPQQRKEVAEAAKVTKPVKPRPSAGKKCKPGDFVLRTVEHGGLGWTETEIGHKWLDDARPRMLPRGKSSKGEKEADMVEANDDDWVDAADVNGDMSDSRSGPGWKDRIDDDHIEAADPGDVAPNDADPGDAGDDSDVSMQDDEQRDDESTSMDGDWDPLDGQSEDGWVPKVRGRSPVTDEDNGIDTLSYSTNHRTTRRYPHPEDEDEATATLSHRTDHTITRRRSQLYNNSLADDNESMAPLPRSTRDATTRLHPQQDNTSLAIDPYKVCMPRSSRVRGRERAIIAVAQPPSHAMQVCASHENEER